MTKNELVIHRVAKKIEGVKCASDLRERLLLPMDLFDSQCWSWTGATSGRSKNRGVLRDPVSKKQIDVARRLFEIVCNETFERGVQVRKHAKSLCRYAPCVNPSHHKLVATWDRRYERFANLPKIPHSSNQDPLSYMGDHDEIEDLVNELLDREINRSWSLERLREKVNPEFTCEEYEEALRRAGIVLETQVE